jgi:site-specific recombinase XerD
LATRGKLGRTDGRKFEAAFDQHRDHLGDQRGLAGAAPAREANDAHLAIIDKMSSHRFSSAACRAMARPSAELSVAGYQRMVARAGVAAKFTFLVHSHMLRHACGFKLANDGHDTRAIQAYLGHRSIMSTVRYTALTPNRFKNFWKD